MIAEKDLQLLQDNAIFIHPDELLLWVGQPSRKCYKKKSKERSCTDLLLAAPLLAFCPIVFISLYRQSVVGFWFVLFLSLVFATMFVHSFFNNINELKHSVYAVTDLVWSR